MEAFDLGWKGMDSITKEVLTPDECRGLLPSLKKPNWVYRYKHTHNPWTLSIATHAEADAQKFSLGGFRIAPISRMSIPNYNNDIEALSLSRGMEEKVAWSRITQVGGPLGYHQLSRIVGGKCVLQPSDDARVGKPRDFELLDFAILCLRDFQSTSGIQVITGQDLGHGIMSDGKTTSIEYLNERFPASVIADTSKPTGEGNFQVVAGALKAFDLSPEKSKVGLIGCGNVGIHILQRLLDLGVECFVVEASELILKRVKSMGVYAWLPEQKEEFLKLQMDALVVNANGGSLDDSTIERVIGNEKIKIVCGSENLALTRPEDERRLLEAGRIYCPTEFCGMMGYLTAVESYLSFLQGVDLDLEGLFERAAKLQSVTHKACQHVLRNDFSLSFREAVRELYS